MARVRQYCVQWNCFVHEYESNAWKAVDVSKRALLLAIEIISRTDMKNVLLQGEWNLVWELVDKLEGN